MKQAQLKSIFITATIFVLILASALAFTVTLNSPSSTWINNNNVPFSFTLTGTPNTSISACAILVNNSGTYLTMANISNPLIGPAITIGIALNNSRGEGLEFGWNVSCLNSTNSVSPSSVNSFGVDGNAPIIVLNSPSNNAYLSGLETSFIYTPFDSSNLQACDFYLNGTGTTGGFILNNTNTSITHATSINYTLRLNFGLKNGSYKWNAKCNDTSGQSSGFVEPNRTFVLDTKLPEPIKFIVPTNNTFSSNTTPYVAWNQTTEDNFDRYDLLVATNATIESPIQIISIFNRINNFTVLNSLGPVGTYFFQIRATDLAGNVRNGTGIWSYNLVTVFNSITLNYPSSDSYLADTTPDFNVTVNESFPDSCDLLLSATGGSTVTLNATQKNVTNGIKLNLTPTTAMNQGVYFFNIECNNSANVRRNASSSLVNFTIDSIVPTHPNLTSSFHGKNNTDATPVLKWVTSVESNFVRYLAVARYLVNNSIAYEVNVTAKATSEAQMTLNSNYTYNFTVTAFDLAANSASNQNTTDKDVYYVDPVCGILNNGWNVCGATWTTAKTLATIGSETGATFVSVWNQSHQFATCNYIGSSTGQHCATPVSIGNGTIHSVFIFMNGTSNWRNRTWVATAASADFRLDNSSNTGWNLEASYIRNGRTFAQFRNKLLNNASLYSLPYNNGSSMSYVSSSSFRTINNNTLVDYGRAIWLFYNETGDTITNTGANFSLASW